MDRKHPFSANSPAALTKALTKATFRAQVTDTSEVARFYPLSDVELVPRLYSEEYRNSPWADMTRGLGLQLEGAGCRPGSVRILVSALMTKGKSVARDVSTADMLFNSWTFDYKPAQCRVSRAKDALGDDTLWEIEIERIGTARVHASHETATCRHRFEFVSCNDPGWRIVQSRGDATSVTFEELGI